MTSLSAHLFALLTVVSRRFQNREERGATAVEYGLLVGLIAIVMITGVALVGPKLDTLFTTVAGKF